MRRGLFPIVILGGHFTCTWPIMELDTFMAWLVNLMWLLQQSLAYAMHVTAVENSASAPS